MAKFNFPVNNFSSGEWSPKMKGRTDTEQYTKACELLKNYIPQMSGGAAYRGGTKFVDIQNSTTQTYLDALLVNGTLPDMKLVPHTPYTVARRNKLLITGAAKWYSIPSGTEVTYGLKVIAGTSLASWTPSLTQYVQLGDVTVLVDGSGTHPPMVYRYYNTVYQLDQICGDYIVTKPWKAIPWDDVNALDSSVTMSINTATVGAGRVLTASASYFNSSMVGTYIRLCNSTATAGIVQITGYTNSTTVTVSVIQAVSAAAFQYGSTTNNQSFWQIHAWNDSFGWPRTVTAHQGRLIYGGNSANPDTIWGSRIGNYFDFEEVPEPNTTGTYGFASGAYLADNSRPFTLTPNSQEASNIYALSSAKSLVINTDRSDIVAFGSTGALGPNDVTFESSTSFGADPVQPVRLNNYLSFVQKGGRKIRDMIFNFQEDQFKSQDLNFVADHYTLLDGTLKNVDSFKELARTQDQNSVLWGRTASGQLYGCTLDRDYQVNAWFRYVVGRPSQDTTTVSNGGYCPVISICEFPEDTDNYSSLYILTMRKINGTLHLCLENSQPIWELGNPFAGIPFSSLTVPAISGRFPYYLDFAQRITKSGGSATTSFNTKGTYLNPYRNSTVSVVADGNYVGDFTIANDANGTLTLTDPANEIIVGYKYQGKITTFPVEQGSVLGSAKSKVKAIPRATIEFVNTIGTSYGYPGFVQEAIDWVDPTQPTGEGIAFFTGQKIVDYPSDYSTSIQVELEQNYPYPSHILAIALEGVTYD